MTFAGCGLNSNRHVALTDKLQLQITVTDKCTCIGITSTTTEKLHQVRNVE